jgi:hypothetical protein
VNKSRVFTKLPLLMLPLLAACASGPTQEQIDSADYGKEMAPAECVAIAERLIADKLKDPSSAQFRSSSSCFKGHWGAAPIFGMKAEFGWVQTGEVNGKNAYGGYVGFRPYRVLMKNGRAIRYCTGDKDGLCMPSHAN